MDTKYTARFDRRTLLWAVVDNATEEIIAYVPNGKTKIPAAVGECAHCLAINKKFAKKLAAGLNLSGGMSLQGDRNLCNASVRLI